jgi:hypothetical protein
MLLIPPYIAAARIDSPEVRYRWDEWADKDQIYQQDTDQELRQRVAPLSQRGRIALSNGVAEWLVYRFARLLPNQLPLDALEAAWAGVVDRKYVLPLASFRDDDKEDWSGPVMGAIRRGLLFVSDTIDLAWENGATMTFFISLTNLTRYVLPQTEEFDGWLREAIERLGAISPRTPEDFVGEVIPREALDTARPFDEGATEVRIQRFLAALVPGTNPYLASRKTMLNWGFEREPYTFDIAADRESRRIGSDEG